MSALSEDRPDKKTADLIAEYMTRFFEENPEGYRRIKENIFKIYETGFDYDLIITSKLVIYDLLLFDELPKQKGAFYEELLRVNGLRTKGATLCLTDEGINLRLIRGHEEYPYSAFRDNLQEFRLLAPQLRTELIPKFFS